MLHACILPSTTDIELWRRTVVADSIMNDEIDGAVGDKTYPEAEIHYSARKRPLSGDELTHKITRGKHQRLDIGDLSCASIFTNSDACAMTPSPRRSDGAILPAQPPGVACDSTTHSTEDDAMHYSSDAADQANGAADAPASGSTVTNTAGGPLSTINAWQFSFMRNVTSESPKSALCRTDFEPNPLIFDFVRQNLKILIIGAGGLGCELLKNLALNGFTQLHIIDMDTIDLSNLNRQFLFKDSDIGKSKAEVAARHIQTKIPTANVKAYFNRIEDFDADFYRQFKIIVSGLDSIAARRWINSLLVSLLRYDDITGALLPETVSILIDGGTEGFKGNVRVITTGMSACFECTLGLFPPQTNFPLCTIAHTPRLPEHCLEYVKIIQWPQDEPFGVGVPVDGDNPVHVEWIRNEAVKRAETYRIPTQPITFQLTQGVLKRIIPAVASTNAVVAAACATEVFKVATSVYKAVDNQFLFNQTDGVYTHTYAADRLEDCMVCSQHPQILRGFSHSKSTLSEVAEALQSDTGAYKMRAPSLFMTTKTGRQFTLYMPTPKSLEEQTRPNLDKTLAELGFAQPVQELSVQDVTLATPRTFKVIFEGNELVLG